MVGDLALDAGARDEVVHPVEATQHRGLAATGRADERGDLVAVDLEVDVAHGPERAVVHREVVDVEDRSAPARPRRSPATVGDAAVVGRCTRCRLVIGELLVLSVMVAHLFLEGEPCGDDAGHEA